MSCNWILHDYLQVNGGAERLVLTAARKLPNVSLGTAGVYSDFLGSSNCSGADVHVLGRLPNAFPRVPQALYTFSRRCSEIADASVVIYSGIYAPLAVASQKRGRRIYYCHTPPRFAFDRTDQYLAKYPAGLRMILQVMISRYRKAYLRAVGAMDLVLANSEHVQRRLAALGRKAEVLYPPIATNSFRWQSEGDYFLSLGRLEPNKRVDRIVSAFVRMPEHQLVVASGGSQLNELQALAGRAPNIRFTGWCDDAELADLIGNARACIYIPRDEDFGMSAIEAMAAGKPTIGCDEGGLRETIVDRSTGFLLPSDPSVDEVIDCVRKTSRPVASAMRFNCEEHARRFTEDIFIEKLRSHIRS